MRWCGVADESWVFLTLAGLGHELLLRKDVAGEGMVQLPHLVQQLQLRVGVEAQVARQLADSGPILVLDVGALVLVLGT